MNMKRYYDISLTTGPELPVWPGDPQIQIEPLRAIRLGHASNDSQLTCSVHSGTHIDAPRHFYDEGKSVESLSLESLVGEAYVAELPAGTEMVAGNLLENMRIPDDIERLLLKSRNSNLWSQANHVFQDDYVALDASAADWVVRRGIRLIGVDYLSIEYFRSPRSETHKILLKAEVVIVEGLNLQQVATGRYQLLCLPIKLQGADGAPARAILIEE